MFEEQEQARAMHAASHPTHPGFSGAKRRNILEHDNRRAGGGAWCSEQDIYDAWERPLQILFGERSSDFEIVSYGENGDEDGFERDWKLDMDISSKLPLGGTIGED